MYLLQNCFAKIIFVTFMRSNIHVIGKQAGVHLHWARLQVCPRLSIVGDIILL